MPRSPQEFTLFFFNKRAPNYGGTMPSFKYSVSLLQLSYKPIFLNLRLAIN